MQNVNSPTINPYEAFNTAWKLSTSCPQRDGSDKFWQNVKRHWKFIRDPGEENELYKISLTATVFTGIFGGTLVGSQFGENIRDFLGISKKSKETLQIIGGATGGIVGGVGGFYAYLKIAEGMNNFARWKIVQIGQEIKEELMEEYENDPILKLFSCCVLHEVVCDLPVRTPSGDLYEYKNLVKCPTDTDDKIIDPTRKSPSFHKNDLHPDFETSLVVCKRLLHLLKKNSSKLKNTGDEKIKKKLDRQERYLENAIDNRYHNLRSQIQEMSSHKQIDYKTFLEQHNTIIQLYGEDSKIDLDWENNWEDILKERWSKFYKQVYFPEKKNTAQSAE